MKVHTHPQLITYVTDTHRCIAVSIYPRTTGGPDTTKRVGPRGPAAAASAVCLAGRRRIAGWQWTSTGWGLPAQSHFCGAKP